MVIAIDNPAQSDRSSDYAAWRHRYCAHLRYERCLSPHTVSAYRRDLGWFGDFLGTQGESAHWQQADAATIRRFIVWRHHQRIDGRSIQRALAAVRGLYDYALRHQVVAANPALGVVAPKSDQCLPQVMDVDRVATLMRSQGDAPLLKRDRAILELLYSSGLRLAELVGIDMGHLDLAEALVKVSGKGDKQRIVPVGAQAIAALHVWFAVRQRIAAADETAVFVSRRGGRMGMRAVQQRLKRWQVRSGVEVGLYPHLLRHSCASHLLESSGDLRAVQELLGHANIGTTQIYTHLDYQHLAQIYDTAHPRARIGKKQ